MLYPLSHRAPLSCCGQLIKGTITAGKNVFSMWLVLVICSYTVVMVGRAGPLGRLSIYHIYTHPSTCLAMFHSLDYSHLLQFSDIFNFKQSHIKMWSEIRQPEKGVYTCGLYIWHRLCTPLALAMLLHGNQTLGIRGVSVQMAKAVNTHSINHVSSWKPNPGIRGGGLCISQQEYNSCRR